MDEHNLNSTFARYMSLNILGMVGMSGYILADTFFVAIRLGSDGLAALNLAISVFGFINGLGMMLGIAAPPGTPSARPGRTTERPTPPSLCP